MRKLVAAIALALVLARTGTASAGAEANPGESVTYWCETKDGQFVYAVGGLGGTPKQSIKEDAKEVEREIEEETGEKGQV